MLKKQRIAAQRGIKNPDTENPLERDEPKSGREDRCGQDQNDARRVEAPKKERKAQPRQARARIL